MLAEAQGETAVRFELAAVEWRKLDAEATRERVRWMRGGRRRSCRVCVTSDEAHIKLRTQVAGVRGRKRSRRETAKPARIHREPSTNPTRDARETVRNRAWNTLASLVPHTLGATGSKRTCPSS